MKINYLPKTSPLVTTLIILILAIAVVVYYIIIIPVPLVVEEEDEGEQYMKNYREMVAKETETCLQDITNRKVAFKKMKLDLRKYDFLYRPEYKLMMRNIIKLESIVDFDDNAIKLCKERQILHIPYYEQYLTYFNQVDTFGTFINAYENDETWMYDCFYTYNITLSAGYSATVYDVAQNCRGNMDYITCTVIEGVHCLNNTDSKIVVTLLLSKPNNLNNEFTFDESWYGEFGTQFINDCNSWDCTEINITLKTLKQVTRK